MKIEKDIILVGDAFRILCDMPDNSVDCVVTSPPYWGLRDYGVEGQIGLEEDVDCYVYELFKVFYEIRRILKPTGTMFLNLGDTYANNRPSGGMGKNSFSDAKANRRKVPRSEHKHHTGLPRKSLLGIPWKVAFALQRDGWILRNEIIWHKPNCMPSSVKDPNYICRQISCLSCNGKPRGKKS